MCHPKAMNHARQGQCHHALPERQFLGHTGTFSYRHQLCEQEKLVFRSQHDQCVGWMSWHYKHKGVEPHPCDEISTLANKAFPFTQTNAHQVGIFLSQTALSVTTVHDGAVQPQILSNRPNTIGRGKDQMINEDLNASSTFWQGAWPRQRPGRAIDPRMTTCKPTGNPILIPPSIFQPSLFPPLCALDDAPRPPTNFWMQAESHSSLRSNTKGNTTSKHAKQN